MANIEVCIKYVQITFVSGIKQSMSALKMAPGVPLPNADVLYRIIMTRVFQAGSSVNGSDIVDFLLGKTKPRDPDIPRINVLDYPTFRNLIKKAKERHMKKTLVDTDEKQNETRTRRMSSKERQHILNKDQYDDGKKRARNTIKFGAYENYLLIYYRTRRPFFWNLFWPKPYSEMPNEDDDVLRQFYAFRYSLKIMSLIQQCIYQTQYNLKKTKYYRKRFQIDLNYQFALMYGMILESKDKIDSLLNMMLSLLYTKVKNRPLVRDEWEVPHKFIYFLSIYEKVLAANTDINYLAHHLMELTRGIREGIRAAQKRAEPKDKGKRPEVRRHISHSSKKNKKI